MVSTNCRMGTSGRTWSTRFGAPALMRLPRQLGHTARTLHEKATAWYSPQGTAGSGSGGQPSFGGNTATATGGSARGATTGSAGGAGGSASTSGRPSADGASGCACSLGDHGTTGNGAVVLLLAFGLLLVRRRR